MAEQKVAEYLMAFDHSSTSCPSYTYRKLSALDMPSVLLESGRPDPSGSSSSTSSDSGRSTRGSDVDDDLFVQDDGDAGYTSDVEDNLVKIKPVSRKSSQTEPLDSMDIDLSSSSLPPVFKW